MAALNSDERRQIHEMKDELDELKAELAFLRKDMTDMRSEVAKNTGVIKQIKFIVVGIAIGLLIGGVFAGFVSLKEFLSIIK